MTATHFLLRLHGDHLTPDYQPGDALEVKEQDHADEGELAVVLVDDQGSAGVRRYRAADGHPVVGVVVGMYRRVPGVSA